MLGIKPRPDSQARAFEPEPWLDPSLHTVNMVGWCSTSVLKWMICVTIIINISTWNTQGNEVDG